MEGFAFTAARSCKGEPFPPGPVQQCQVINSGKIRRAGLIADFMKKRIF